MQEGFILKADTYGKLKVETGAVKPGEIAAAICPDCGEISFAIKKEG